MKDLEQAQRLRKFIGEHIQEEQKQPERTQHLDDLYLLQHILEFLDETKGYLRFCNKPWHFDGFSVSEPVLEKLKDDEVRLSIHMPMHVAEMIRSKFSLALVPAAIDASEALVRATHALAGAAIEMTHVAKKLGEKL